MAATGTGTVFTDGVRPWTVSSLVSCGGAYALLSYIAHQAVVVCGWLAPGEMARGLALAETTPGPLIMVSQFVARIAAYRDRPTGMDPWVAFLVGSVLCTVLILVPQLHPGLHGRPFVERLRGNHALSSGALTGITAPLSASSRTWRSSSPWSPCSVRSASPRGARCIFRSPTSRRSSGSRSVWHCRGGAAFSLKWPVLRILRVCALLGLGAGLMGQVAG